MDHDFVSVKLYLDIWLSTASHDSLGQLLFKTTYLINADDKVIFARVAELRLLILLHLTTLLVGSIDIASFTEDKFTNLAQIHE